MLCLPPRPDAEPPAPEPLLQPPTVPAIRIRRCLALLALAVAVATASAAPLDISAYPNLQAAIDAHAGGIIQLPPGEYTIDRALTLHREGTELHGPARIVQTNPKEPILRVVKTARVRVANLSLTRAVDRQQAEAPGVDVVGSQDVELLQLRVSDNHSRSSIRAENSRDVSVAGCTVINYKGPVIDDRTAPHHLSGYAFKAIDGTGIQMVAVQNGIIRDNRIQEIRLPANKDTVARYGLGQLTVVPKERGRLMSQEIFDTRFTNNWHQGSGIHVSNPMATSHVLVTGNFIENAGQGVDVHGDNVTLSHNIVRSAIIGMKAMHGSKNVLIDGNQFSHVDLWGIMLMPGAASQVSANADTASGRKVAAENVDGGTVVSNNIISWFGYGENSWNWVGDTSKGPATLCAIAVRAGQIEENPSIHDILITGNVVYDNGRDTVLVDGRWIKQPPRYRYALYVEREVQPAPVNVKVYANLLSPGSLGASNVPDSAN